MALPKSLTWMLVSQEAGLPPILGQFQAEAQWQTADHVWSERPGIAGAEPWLRYLGRRLGRVTFKFHFIGTSIIDPTPSLMMRLLDELTRPNEALGRPPKLVFQDGSEVAEGFILQVPAIPTRRWLHVPLVQEVGPVTLTLAILGRPLSLLSSATQYTLRVDGETYQDLARRYYGSASLGQQLEYHNQAAPGEQVELPRRGHKALVTPVPRAAFLDTGDP